MEFHQELRHPKTRLSGILCGFVCVKTRLAGLTELPTCDASRGKKRLHIVSYCYLCEYHTQWYIQPGGQQGTRHIDNIANEFLSLQNFSPAVKSSHSDSFARRGPDPRGQNLHLYLSTPGDTRKDVPKIAYPWIRCIHYLPQ